MNPANLQLEGLYAALAALTEALRAKGLLSGAEIEDALMRAEDGASRMGSSNLSGANADAIVFPIRYLRVANQASLQGRKLDFSDIAKLIGESKGSHVNEGGHMATPVGGEVKTARAAPFAAGAGAAGDGQSQRGSHSEPQGDMSGATPSPEHPLGEAEFLDMAKVQEAERDA